MGAPSASTSAKEKPDGPGFSLASLFRAPSGRNRSRRQCQGALRVCMGTTSRRRNSSCAGLPRRNREREEPDRRNSSTSRLELFEAAARNDVRPRPVSTNLLETRPARGNRSHSHARDFGPWPALRARVLCAAQRKRVGARGHRRGPRMTWRKRRTHSHARSIACGV